MDQVKVGRFIAALRHERGLTQEMLGRKLGVTNKTVSRWENGNYMPDIELLVPLGEALGVSVNELLAGERLDNAAFRRKADENVVAVARESAFTLKERGDFFKKKWLREHTGLFVVCTLACAGVSFLLYRQALEPVMFLPWFIAWPWLNNRRMAYVEGKLYGNPEPPAKET